MCGEISPFNVAWRSAPGRARALSLVDPLAHVVGGGRDGTVVLVARQELVDVLPAQQYHPAVVGGVIATAATSGARGTGGGAAAGGDGESTMLDKLHRLGDRFEHEHVGQVFKRIFLRIVPGWVETARQLLHGRQAHFAYIAVHEARLQEGGARLQQAEVLGVILGLQRSPHFNGEAHGHRVENFFRQLLQVFGNFSAVAELEDHEVAYKLGLVGHLEVSHGDTAIRGSCGGRGHRAGAEVVSVQGLQEVVERLAVLLTVSGRDEIA